MLDNNHVGHNTISSQSHVPGILGVDNRSLVQTLAGKQSATWKRLGLYAFSDLTGKKSYMSYWS